MLEYYRFKVINNLFLKGQTEAACLQLRELQKRYVVLCEENAALKANTRELEDILFMERNFIFDGIFYWLRTGSLKHGPFCPNCYNRYGQITRIAALRRPVCSICGTTFETPLPETAKNANGGRSLKRNAAPEHMLASNIQDQTERNPGSGAAPKPALKRKAVILPFDP
jgi:protein-arginine kinase activator protein McsA